VAIDFSNAFGSVTDELIISDMAAIGIPTICYKMVENIDANNRLKVCPLSPTLSKNGLENSLRRIEKPGLVNLGYGVKPADWLSEFCTCAKMKVKSKKLILISRVSLHTSNGPAEADYATFHTHVEESDEKVTMEMISIKFGMPICFHRHENSNHRREVLGSMLDHARTIGKSKAKIMYRNLKRLFNWRNTKDVNRRGVVRPGQRHDQSESPGRCNRQSSPRPEHQQTQDDQGTRMVLPLALLMARGWSSTAGQSTCVDHRDRRRHRIQVIVQTGRNEDAGNQSYPCLGYPDDQVIQRNTEQEMCR
jgi:hypothetical protein